LSASFAEGIKTPHARDRPRLCIASVRFGDTPQKKTAALNRKQREVNITPICKLSRVEIEHKRKQRSLFGGNDPKKLKSDGESRGMVTPSFSVTTNATAATHPLTVCSSELTDRTTLSLEEYSKMRPLQITSSSSLQTATNSKGSVNKEIKSNHQTSPPDSGIGPKHITQDTPSISIDLNTGLPHASPPFSPPPGLDKVGSILLSAKKMDAGTPAEKFWSTVGLENFTPYKMRVDGEGSTLSPTSNSKFFENLLEDKGSVSKPAKSSTETPSNNG